VPKTDISAPSKINARAAKIPTYEFHEADKRTRRRRANRVEGVA